MEDPKKREDTINRIRALLAKTTAAGATHEEALLAAEKAGELMEKYRIEMTDIEIRQERVGKIVLQRRYEQRTCPADYAMGGIAAYTGCKTWYATRDTQRVVVFFGLEPDVCFAKYLYKMIDEAIEREAKTTFKTSTVYQFSSGPDRRKHTTSFMVGMGVTIGTRLRELAYAAENRSVQTASGTALVVVKNAIVEEAFTKLGLKLASQKGQGRKISGDSYRAGLNAGHKVNLSRPLSDSSPKPLLQ